MTDGLFIPSGARVPLVGLPAIDRPMRLADGRALRFDDWHRGAVGADGEPCPAQVWRGPAGLLVLASLDVTDAWGPLLHISASYRDRDPTWAELSMLKAAFFGDTDAAMILPKAEDYVNAHHHAFHLWQIPQRWGIR